MQNYNKNFQFQNFKVILILLPQTVQFLKYVSA